MINKNMSYRVYKKRFADCKTLNDYNQNDKTITVLIQDDDPRIKTKRVNAKIWKSYGNEWVVKEVKNFGFVGFFEYSFVVKKYEDGFYIKYLRPNESKKMFKNDIGFDVVDFHKTQFKTKDEAIEYVEKCWNVFKEYIEKNERK